MIDIICVLAATYIAKNMSDKNKRRLRATIFKSAETVHLKLSHYLGDAIRCAVSADLKMIARNHSLL